MEEKLANILSVIFWVVIALVVMAGVFGGLVYLLEVIWR